ncbi:hypothetical protein C8R44DRAFT_742053 [Mycena epipterygia]|nr:hypothetical protein C8R44DRAFT_742053 [Mycena epipterygia]
MGGDGTQSEEAIYANCVAMGLPVVPDSEIGTTDTGTTRSYRAPANSYQSYRRLKLEPFNFGVAWNNSGEWHRWDSSAFHESPRCERSNQNHEVSRIAIKVTSFRNAKRSYDSEGMKMARTHLPLLDGFQRSKIEEVNRDFFDVNHEWVGAGYGRGSGGGTGKWDQNLLTCFKAVPTLNQ